MNTQNNTSTLHTHIGFWLRLVSNNVSSAFAKKLDSAEITVAEWVVLIEMHDNKTINSSTIADITGLTRGAISKMIEKLVQKGYVLRKESSKDRRYQDIALSESGEKLIPQLKQLADINESQFFVCLDENEKNTLMLLLQKLARSNKLTTLPIE